MATRIVSSSLLALCLGLSAATAAWAEGHEDKDDGDQVITIDQVPAAAKEALLKKMAGLVITKVEVENEHGTTTYEATAASSGSELEVTVDATGKLLKTESNDGKDKDEDEKDEKKDGKDKDDGDEKEDKDDGDEKEDGDHDEHEHEGSEKDGDEKEDGDDKEDGDNDKSEHENDGEEEGEH